MMRMAHGKTIQKEKGAYKFFLTNGALLTTQFLKGDSVMDEKIPPKPPIGLEPYYVWESKRIKDILAAMERYSLHGLPIPLAWITELQGHLSINQS